MLKELDSEFKHHPAFTAVILILFIGIWSTLYLSRQIDIDMAWLLQCLERFMEGGTYKSDFYETNPPLSFLAYLPAYPLYSTYGYDPKFSVTLVFLSYLTIAAGTVTYLLHKLKIKPSNILVIISAYLISQTWGAAISFGSKDSLISIFLAPALLYQYSITKKLQLPYFIHFISICIGGIAISLKPHYGLLVLGLFAHRLYETKSLKRCIIAPDFIGLLAFGLGYFAFIKVFTPEFFEILPEILSIYSAEIPFPITSRLYYALYGIGGLAVTFFLFRNSENKDITKAAIAFGGVCMLSLIPYLLQNKGYHYHALPTLCYGYAAVFLGIYALTLNIAKERDYGIIAGIVIIAGITSMYTVGGKNNQPYSKHQYMAQPVPNMIDDYAWNDVYATYDLRSMLTPLPYMTSVTNGSRFGQVWPISGLNEKIKHAKTDEERKEIKGRMVYYVDMIVEDMHRYKPSVITIPKYKDPQTQEPAKNYYNFLMKNEGFAEAMQNYDYIDTLPFDNALTTNAKGEDRIVMHELFVLKRDHSL